MDTAARELLVFGRSEPDAESFDLSLELDRDREVISLLLPGFALALAELFPDR